MATGYESREPEWGAALAACEALLRLCAARVRLEILCVLAAGPRDVSALAAALDLDLAHVSHHLAPLRRAGLVRARRRGKRQVYELGPGCSASNSEHGLVIRFQTEPSCGATIELPALRPRTEPGAVVALAVRPASAAPARAPSAAADG